MTEQSRARRRSVVACPLIFAVALSLNACGQRAAPDKADLAKVLRAYLTKHCDLETVRFRASRLGTDAVLAAETTFATKIAADPHFQSIPGLSSSYGKSGSLSFRENGETLQAKWNEFAPPDADDRDRLTIDACLYVPDKLEITDRSLNNQGKSEDVVFHQTYRLSRIGRSLSSLGMLKGYEQFSAETGFQFIAHLRSDGGSAWRVDSVRLI